MRFHKKESKGIGFGESYPILFKDGKFDPILFKDQKELFEIYQKNPELPRDRRLNIYRDMEKKRIKEEKEKAKNMFYIGMVLAFIVLFITSVTVYIYIPDYSFFIINWLFVIDILFTIYLYSKQYNVYDKLRERELYLAILDINKNISDLTNLIKHINKKD